MNTCISNAAELQCRSCAQSTRIWLRRSIASLLLASATLQLLILGSDLSILIQLPLLIPLALYILFKLKARPNLCHWCASAHSIYFGQRPPRSARISAWILFAFAALGISFQLIETILYLGFELFGGGTQHWVKPVYPTGPGTEVQFFIVLGLAMGVLSSRRAAVLFATAFVAFFAVGATFMVIEAFNKTNNISITSSLFFLAAMCAIIAGFWLPDSRAYYFRSRKRKSGISLSTGK